MRESAFQFDIVIVGAGPAGLAAACAAAESGQRVAVIDNTPWLGGQIWRGEQANPVLPLAREWLPRFLRARVTWLDRTTVIGTGNEGNVRALLAEHPDGPRKIVWNKLILATGARELFLPFPGWTLPGVLGPGGLLSLVKNGWPVAGKKVVVAGTGPLLLAVADGLKQHGANIVCVAEQAARGRVLSLGVQLLRFPAKLAQLAGLKARLAGVSQRYGVWPVRAVGREAVEAVELTDGRKRWTEACDLLACGFHLVPNLELPGLLGCALAHGFVRVNEWQATGAEGIYCAGEATGIGGAEGALLEGRIAGYAAAGQLARARALFAPRAASHRFRAALAGTFRLRPELKSLAAEDTTFCRCEDVAFGRVKAFAHGRAAKLLTRCGMGACQGRTCGAAAKIIFGWEFESVRPPVLPARINSLLAQPKA
jgi:NADPH-dependent 2,4-dienoyl-CoA reductase/sulfur reductase-like enzyme